MGYSKTSLLSAYKSTSPPKNLGDFEAWMKAPLNHNRHNKLHSKDLVEPEKSDSRIGSH